MTGPCTLRIVARFDYDKVVLDRGDKGGLPIDETVGAIVEAVCGAYLSRPSTRTVLDTINADIHNHLHKLYADGRLRVEDGVWTVL